MSDAYSAHEVDAPDVAATGSTGGGDSVTSGEDTTEKGFVGVEVDKTPNSHYTLSGVAAGLPTPETETEGGE